MPTISSNNASTIHQTSGIKLLKRALRLIRAIDPTETLDASSIKDGLEALNLMLDSWNAEGLIVPARERNEFTMIPGQQQYEIGPGFPFDSKQVVKIEQGDAYLKNNNVEYVMKVVSQERWAGIPLKETTGLPGIVYYQMGAPFGLVNFFYVPDAAYTFVLYVRQLLSQIVQTAEVFQLLPGYADAIAYGLALAMAPEYGKSAEPAIVAGATEGKAKIKRQNLKVPILSCDPALQAVSGGGFPIDFFSGMSTAASDGWGDSGWGDGSWPA